MDELLLRAVNEAAARAEVRAAVGAVYADVRREVDLRRPRCEISGRCCRFEEYGHRLFVTTAELAAFVHGLGDMTGGARPLALAPAGPWDGTGCPFQSNKMCGVHAIRPFGCRMFFCDATSTDWQNDAYERFHDRLKRVHEELAVPYFYVEWRQALKALGLPGGLSAAPGSF